MKAVKLLVSNGAETVDLFIENGLGSELKIGNETITLKAESIKWDEVKNPELSFQDFGTEALHRLQRQFLNTPDTKDTVLTRMNIIQMIKDLKELGLK